MKEIVSRAVALIACIVFMCFPASAHPGRTDANGGHHDYNNVSGLGDYHYHHGYPAHLHEGGVCPYDFDDRTGWNSGGSSSSSSSKPASSNQQSGGSFDLIKALFYLICGFCVSILVLSAFVCMIYLITQLPQIIRERRCAARYRVLYRGPIETLCKYPPGTEIGPDGLPKETGAKGWGSSYTFYRSRTGKVYHQAGCNRAANVPIHAARIPSHLRPCSKCHPTLPNLEWFQEYEKIRLIKEKYGIE